MSRGAALQDCVCALWVTVSTRGRLKGYSGRNGAAEMRCFQYV
jgi:hypothetical protein